MAHRLILAAAAALSLASCGGPAADSAGGGANPAAQAVQAMTGGAPVLFQASFRLDAQIFDEATGAAQPITLVRDGRNTRFEMRQAEMGDVAVVFNGDEAFMLTEAMGEKLAMRMPTGMTPTSPEEDWSEEAGSVRRVGDCSVIGERGVEWESTDTGDGMTGRACITADGVILRASEGERVVWEATRLQRGPQDPALFGVPSDYRIFDVGAAAAAAAEAFGQARTGQ